jgi:phosphoglycerol transferase
VQFLSPFGPTDYFSTHYVPPASVTLHPNGRKNLVLIYIESLEASYSRTDLFGRDLLASLGDLHPVSFDAYEQMPGTGFTIAAIVSTQCGVPLEPIGFLDPQFQGERAKQFLPSAVCLGDLLASQGYQNVYLGGASLQFSGKGRFLRSHHYQQMFGREQWIKEGVSKAHISGWGLHDDDLFEQAKLKLRELHAAGQPFNLTMLTVDTHWPSGYLSPLCQQQGAKGLDDIFECAARQVADLVRFVRAEGFDADTNIVVLGDHVSPPNTLAAKLDRVPKRLIYNAFFSKVPPAPNRAEIVHFDMMPTILDFIGVHPEGGRLGLGFTGFGPMPTPAPSAQSRAELADNVLAPSRVYSGLWEPLPTVSAAAHADPR